jgi:hypothetical protein
VIRQALVANVQIILPYLCLWDWIWPYYRCDELVTVETDGQGRFDTTIYYLCAGDHPDLYFWVEFNIGGTWTPVYKPSVNCNTYWNYLCGSEVTLRVSDPRVPVCSEPPDLAGLQVAIMSIGNNVSIHEIQGSSAGIAQGLTTAGQPFGGVLEPHVWFGRTALFAANITYYRWSYRRLTMSNGTTPVSDSWHAMDRKVIRHYAVIDPTPPDYPLSFVPDVMGPDPSFGGQNLFRIQPLDPPPGSSGWAPIDAREDSAAAFLQSHLLEGGNAEAAAGKYELKLELFRSNGTLVNITDAGIQLKVPTVNAPFGAGTVTTTPAPIENRILDGAGKVTAFRTVIHIDNTPCEAEIYTVSGPGLSVDANCGYIEYTSDTNTLHIAFKARHPRNFATFSFTTYRGSSRFVAEASASGSVGTSPINGFVRNPSSMFSKDVTVHTLLTSNTVAGSTPCSKAAFAENLYVWAMATDGWQRLSYLDDQGTPKAFALAPVP